MSTARELNQVFDMVEELVGIDPSAEDLTNAIHAIITKDVKRRVYIGSSMIVKNVNYLARQYKAVR